MSSTGCHKPPDEEALTTSVVTTRSKTKVAAARRRGLNSGRGCLHTFTPNSSPLLYIAQQFTGSPWVIKCTPFYPKKRREAKGSARAQYNPPLAPSELLDGTGAGQGKARPKSLPPAAEV